jgi:hypothetical protein
MVNDTCVRTPSELIGPRAILPRRLNGLIYKGLYLFYESASDVPGNDRDRVCRDAPAMVGMNWRDRNYFTNGQLPAKVFYPEQISCTSGE